MDEMKKQTNNIVNELKQHLPFTAFATITAIAVFVIIQYYFKVQISENLFEIFHPVHVIASAIVTAGIFYKHKAKVIQALIIGISGALILGSLSDIVLPFLSGNILGLETAFHLPLIETPLIILGSAFLGSVIGIWSKRTKVPHFIHVYLSAFASLFYLIAFTPEFKLLGFTIAFFTIIIAVVLPCCISDLIYPFIFLKKSKHKNVK